MTDTPQAPHRQGGASWQGRAMLRRLLANKPEKTWEQLLGYGLVGGSAATVDIGAYWWLIAGPLEMDYRIAILCSFTLGTLINFALSNCFVFERLSLSMVRACARHYFSSLGGLATNEAVTIFLVELVLGEDAKLVSKIIATGCSFIVNFTVFKLYAFNGRLSLRRTLGRFLP